MPSPQTFDLTTVAVLIEYANLISASSEVTDIAQEIISGFSQEVYRYTGRSVNSFTSVGTFDEFYDGNDSDILYPANAPIVTVTALTVNGATIPQSTGVTLPGWFIDRDAKCLKMRTNSGASGAATFANTDWATFTGLPYYRFLRGRGNVELQYTAGYSAVPSDLLMATLKQCTIWLNRRLREDERSRNIPNAGTTAYAPWAWSPDVFMLVSGLKRLAAYT